MPPHAVRNRVLAGGFLLLALVGAVAILVLVGGWDHWFRETQVLRVRLRAAPNLRVGSPVLLAGHPVGRAEAIALREVEGPPGGQRPTYYLVEVTTSLPRVYVIHKNARIVIMQALVGQSALLNIEDVGYGEKATDFVVGEQASPFAAAADELGIGEKEKQSIPEIIENLRAISGTVRDVARKDIPEIVDKLKVTGENLAQGSKKAGDTLDKVNLILDENRESLKATVANARSVTERADKRSDEILASLQASADKVQAVIDENRPDIRQTITRVRNVAEKADENVGALLANIRAASEDLKKGIADFAVVAADAKALVATNRANVAAMLQNFRQTSEHLKALAKEVRRAPWRLFAAPDKQEVESINLYDTARAFASAASDLDSLSDTIEVMIEAKDRGIAVDPQILQDMLDRLRRTFEDYKQAEDALFKEFGRIQK